MNKQKNPYRHWLSVFDDNDEMKNNARKNIRKTIPKFAISLICAVAGFSLLALPNLTAVPIMLLLGFGCSSSVMLVSSFQKIWREGKWLKTQKTIDKCAEKPKVEKLNKRELEIYNLMFDREILQAKEKASKNQEYLER